LRCKKSTFRPKNSARVLPRGGVMVGGRGTSTPSPQQISARRNTTPRENAQQFPGGRRVRLGCHPPPSASGSLRASRASAALRPDDDGLDLDNGDDLDFLDGSPALPLRHLANPSAGRSSSVQRSPPAPPSPRTPAARRRGRLRCLPPPPSRRPAARIAGLGGAPPRRRRPRPRGGLESLDGPLAPSALPPRPPPPPGGRRVSRTLGPRHLFPVCPFGQYLFNL
jgi:hypothetical protein